MAGTAGETSYGRVISCHASMSWIQWPEPARRRPLRRRPRRSLPADPRRRPARPGDRDSGIRRWPAARARARRARRGESSHSKVSAAQPGVTRAGAAAQRPPVPSLQTRAGSAAGTRAWRPRNPGHQPARRPRPGQPGSPGRLRTSRRRGPRRATRHGGRHAMAGDTPCRMAGRLAAMVIIAGCGRRAFSGGAGESSGC
jgi:hypothetical protein